MLDKPTLQHLQASSVTVNALKVFTEDHPGVPLSALPIPSDMTLKDMEPYLPRPRRFRGQFKTRYLAEFVRYTDDQCINTEPPSLFIDPEALSALALFDLGSRNEPGHAEHSALLSLQSSIYYDAVERLCNQVRLSQRELAEWMEEWAPDLNALDGEGNEIPIGRAINAVRKITVSAAKELARSTQSLRETRSTMEDIVVRGESDSLPSSLHFFAEPFWGMSERRLSMRINPIVKEDEVLLAVKWVGLEKLTEAVALELQGSLRESLSSMDRVYIGKFIR